MIIKIAGARRSGFAYEAKNMQRVIIFYGGLSCAVGSALIAIQEAMVEAAIKARNLGYSQILFLSDSKITVQVANKERNPQLAGKESDDRSATLTSEWSSLSFLFCFQGYFAMFAT